VGDWVGRVGWGQSLVRGVRGLGRTIKWGPGSGARAGDRVVCGGWVEPSGKGQGRARGLGTGSGARD
jgi:hypothetical protein